MVAVKNKHMSYRTDRLLDEIGNAHGFVNQRNCPKKWVGLALELENELHDATFEIERLKDANLQLREGIEELKKRIQRWHDTLTPLMPSDLKSWHENNPDELPEVAAWVIESQRQRIAELEAENDAMRADLLLWEEKEAKS